MIKVMSLAFLLSVSPLTAGFFGFFAPEPHITESTVCQKVMEDHNKLATMKEKKDFLSELKTSAALAKEKYNAANNTEKVKKLGELEQCIAFLNFFSNYVSDLKEAKPVFDQIDPAKANSALVKKVLAENALGHKSYDASNLNRNEAWDLYNCQPCQKVKHACLKEDGSFDKEKAEKLHSLARVFTNTKERKMRTPESMSDKAEVLEACIRVVKVRMESEKQANKADEYL